MRDDAELLAAWRAGERAAGEALLSRHFDAVHRFFRFKVPEDAAADLIQQTFLAICEGRERFRGESAFRTYLLGTARLILLSYFRKRRRDLERVDPLEQSVAELGPTPSYALARRREEEILVQALRELPLDLQIAFELYHLEGMTAGELARMHGLSEPGMYGRLRKARLLVVAACERIAETPALREATVERLDDWVRGLQAQIGARGRG
ncbi:MAG: sigma-70 family RNA polymerase sigma factor [Myxococcales bacterium]|nr:sigma-70 family RNA polymerase sigma factor [Myxococcales bacterium]